MIFGTNTTLANVYKNINGDAYTTSGNKEINGQFFYESL